MLFVIMKVSVRLDEVNAVDFPGRQLKTLLESSTVGSVGFTMGVIRYLPGCVVEPHTHDDQEGIYVMKGKGKARIGEEDIDLGPGVAFYIAKGARHSVRNPFDEPLEVVFCHCHLCD